MPEADPAPVNVTHGPACHAMERGDLVCLRQSAELVVRQAERPADKPSDLESPRRRIEHRHRAGDRVDPPATDRAYVREQLGEDGRDGCEGSACGARPEKRTDPAREQPEEGASPVAARIRALSADGAPPPRRESQRSSRHEAPALALALGPASFARRFAACRAGTTRGRTDTRRRGHLALPTSRSTSGLPVALTGHWSSSPLAPDAWRSRLRSRRAGA